MNATQHLPLTVSEFCTLERIHPVTFRNLRRKGQGPVTYRIGRAVRISQEAYAQWRKSVGAVNDALQAV